MRRLILTAFLVLLVMAVTGCERKIVNEIVSETPPDETTNCFTCHNDTDVALVAARTQYDYSGHGTGVTYNRNRTYEVYYASCEPCHTNEGFVAEVTGSSVNGSYFSRIGCFTCHAPHSDGNLALRYDDALTLADGTAFDKGSGNMCAYCHQSRVDVNTFVAAGDTLDIRWGPHYSTQADMLAATNGYEYAGYSYRISSHYNSTDGCLQCHMANAVYATGGHSFYMEDEVNHYQNVKGCNGSVCHNGGVDSLDHNGSQTEVVEFLDSLQVLLVDAGLLTAIEDHGEMVYLATDSFVVPSADSAGALFNWLFVKNDQSYGNHNPFYSKDLLISAIQFMNETPAKLYRENRNGLIAAH